MSVLIIHSYDDADRQGYLHNIYILKFIDDNNFDDIVDEKLFWEFKKVFKDWTVNIWLTILATKNLKRFLCTRGVYTSPIYKMPVDQIIALNEAKCIPEWPDTAIANITLVPKSKLYSLLKEG